MKFLLIIFFILFNSVSNAASFNCVYEYRDKNGILKSDVFSTAYVEINTWLRKITFFPIKMEHMKRNEGIKFETINFEKVRKNSYKSEKFKQRKLSLKEKEIYKDKREYIWEDVKDDYLRIWFRNIKSNPFYLEVSPVNLQKKWLKSYKCYVPRKRK